MIPRRWFLLAALAIAAAHHGLSASEAGIGLHSERENDMIQLDISGEQGTRFSGILTIHDQGETHQQHLEDTVPVQLTLTGERIVLELTQDSEGSLDIELRKGGNRSTSRISGPGSRVRLSAH